MLSNFFDWMLGWLNKIVALALSILPDSPLQTDTAIQMLQNFTDIMGVINYFIPVGILLNITAAYLTAVLIWYGVRWVLRFANYID